ncbi:MAG TPA: chloride channel protein, partial [Actinomycetota bacterium]|nr:chloride channel protein [Actinomycetota bacterium]
MPTSERPFDARVPRSTHVHTPMGRLLVLTGLAILIGLAAGGAAWLLLHLIRGITNFALLHRWSWAEPDLAHFHPGPLLFLAAVVGAVIVSLFAKWAPPIRGHGLPETMEAILTRQSRIRPRVAFAKPVASAIAIGTGGPFGAEGPIIVTGGALGSLVGQLLPVSPSERKILLASGAAAGMAATFGAPLAAVVLAIELLLFEFSTRAFVPLVVASSVAGAVHIAFFGSGALFTVAPHDFAGLDKLPFYVLIGLIAGGLAIVITRGLVFFEDLFERLPLDIFWHPIIGALGFAIVGFFVPRALGVGYGSISDVLSDRLVVSTLLVLFFAKLFAWWIALASGTSGGTLAPILLISGSFGALLGHGLHGVYGGIGPGAIAVVTMAATFGAATRATFTSIVFLFELTRDYRIILPLMLASVIADLVSQAFLKDSLFTEKLTRRGLRVRGEYEVDVLRTTFVRQVMTTDLVVLPVTASIEEGRATWQRTRHSSYPLVD